MADDPPKPQLARLFEAIASLMDLDDEGETTLELIFDGGRLRSYFVHRRRRAARTLRQYDERAAQLVAHLELER